jgi:hypothetical protein
MNGQAIFFKEEEEEDKDGSKGCLTMDYTWRPVG